MFDDIVDALFGRERRNGSARPSGLRGMIGRLAEGDEDDDNRNRRRQDPLDFDRDRDDFEGRDRQSGSDRSRRSDRDGMDWD